WLVNNFPPEKYSMPEGGFTVTPQISIGEWRDTVLRVLMEKGTAEACRQIEKIAKVFPHHIWLKQHTLLEARRIALQKSWLTPQTDLLLKLVENHDLRLVNTPDELMDIVLDSLDNLEKKLQRKEQPEISNLWNEKSIPQGRGKKRVSIAWPKDEGRLSDNIKNHLEEDLEGIIIGREVQIERGSKTDIHVSTFSRDYLGRPKDLLKVIIEVKGCWNDELNTAMENQLVKKYLLSTDCSEGIYLIGWFQCDQWNDPDPKEVKRKNKCSKLDLQEAIEKYKDQAQKLSSSHSLRVECVILDCRYKA
ncbi:MAG TPA: hypothetical protein VF941_04420, partial [Clostridia bacterium]